MAIGDGGKPKKESCSSCAVSFVSGCLDHDRCICSSRCSANSSRRARFSVATTRDCSCDRLRLENRIDIEAPCGRRPNTRVTCHLRAGGQSALAYFKNANLDQGNAWPRPLERQPRRLLPRK